MAEAQTLAVDRDGERHFVHGDAVGQMAQVALHCASDRHLGGEISIQRRMKDLIVILVPI